MMKKKLLIIVLLIAAFFRFWQLTSIPPSISWDEAAIGYNAWSILKTGKDEFGQTMPMLFQSFDDYKLPGMIYTTAVSEAVFGLNEFGVRFPSAAFGVGIVFVLYLLGRQLYKGKKGEYAGLVIAFVAAINPWLISFSRQAFESNASAFFVTLGVYYLVRWGRRKTQLSLALAAAFLGVSIYYYYAARITIPFIALAFALAYWKDLLKYKKQTIIAFFVGLFVILPIVPKLFSSDGFSRINQVALINDPRYTERVERYIEYHRGFTISPQLARYIFHRKKALVDEFGANYFRNISPKFWYYNGAGLHGLLYYWEIPTVLIGLFVFARRKNKDKWAILAWLVAYPIAASMTKDQPNSLRTLVGAPVVVFMSGIGLYQLLIWLKSKTHAKIAYAVVVFAIVVSLANFSYTYFVVQPEVRAHDFGDGHKQMVQYVIDHKDDFETIWITGDYWRPYIHLLFHMQYDPIEFQKNANADLLDNIIYAQAAWDEGGVQLDTAELDNIAKGSTLFILSDREYHFHTNKGRVFRKETSIDGAYSKHEFWAVEL